jgi:dephospho-CoA kinase
VPDDPPTPPEIRPTLVLGVLGGIASGKSAVARLLAGEEGLVIDADALANEVLASTELAERVRATFGPGALGADGLPDRSALARIVFADAAARSALEGWIHPRVRARISALLEDAKARGVPRVVLDVPLLLESAPDRGSDDSDPGKGGQHDLAALCDALVFVDAPLEERERRAAAHRGWEVGEVARREAAQLPLEAKRERADLTIRNDAGLDQLRAAVRDALVRLGAA